MASQMGSERDALINQAMFMFARLNGFIESANGAPAPGGAVAKPGNGSGPPARPPAGPTPRGAAPPVLAPNKEPAPRPNRPEPPAQKLDDDPVRREVAERV